ncbi:hypothetical protein MRB56_07125 [Halomonas cupida]|uniref:hypothetical protein n=1 Tax=Halomonas cupida TaxID=44933 RepID=UPI0039B5FEB1
MAAQGRAAVGHQADARPHHTSRSAHLRQCGADDNQIDQDEPFDCHVNSCRATRRSAMCRPAVPAPGRPLSQAVASADSPLPAKTLTQPRDKRSMDS